MQRVRNLSRSANYSGNTVNQDFSAILVSLDNNNAQQDT